jgi:hypothetical protein
MHLTAYPNEEKARRIIPMAKLGQESVYYCYEKIRGGKVNYCYDK